tara:strand:- start:220 stop:462 length:243 start_codon:yes stop_codon:yes gene_type:complete
MAVKKVEIWNGNGWESITLNPGSNANKTIGTGEYAKTINVDYPSTTGSFEGSYVSSAYYKHTDPNVHTGSADTLVTNYSL